MSDEILKILTPVELFKIPMPGFKIPVTDVVVVTWLIMAVIIAIAWLLTSKLKEIPGKRQAFAEVIVSSINNAVKDQVGHHYKMVAPYIGTIILFLAVANTVSIFNIIPKWEQMHALTGWEFFEKLPQIRLLPPTRNVNVTAALGIMSIFSVIIFSIRAKGLLGWIKGFKKPMGIMIPFNILDYMIRPLSLCFRLFGNVLGGVIIMELIYLFLPIGIPIALSFFFDIFDGLLQAYVFTFLTTMYISDAVEE